MKPIRGPIDYGGYPPRKKRGLRARETSPAPPSDEETAAQETERALAERAARLRERAESFRRATHDAHGFPTRGHVLLPHENAPDDEASHEENASSQNVVKRAATQRRKNSQSSNVRRAPRLSAQQKADAQAAQRDRSNPNWKRVRRLTWITSGILGMQIVALSLTRPEMNVARVSVQGAQLTPNRVLDNVRNRFVGHNFLRVRTADATTTLRALPVVKEAHVARNWTWPPQMTISVVERAPFVRVGNERGWFVADESGVPFRAAEKSDDKLEAVFNATWTPILGQKLEAKSWARAASFIALLGRQRATGQNWNLRRVYFDAHGFVSLRLTGGFHDETLVQLGGDGWSQKLSRARQSLDYLEANGRRAEALNLITLTLPVWTARAPLAPPEKTRNG